MRNHLNEQSVLERGLGSVIVHKEHFHRATADGQTSDQHCDECVIERTSILLTEFADVLMEAAKKGERQIVLELLDVLLNILFKSLVFNLYLNSHTDSRDIFSKRTSKVMKFDGFHRSR